jgi:hypothetical protein
MVTGSLVLAMFATPALANGKCGDAPYAFGEDDLVVTWSVPVPKGAKVRYVDDQIFGLLERQMGSEIPPSLPEKYLKDLRYVDLSNAQMSTSVEETTTWLKRYGIAMVDAPAKALRSYIDRGNHIFSTLIDHPAVPNFNLFGDCSIVLQRGIIVMSEGYETMYLRSYFHSSDGKGTSVNFVPKGGLKIAFPSKTVWFPLELTKFISEPAAHVVLDILTPQPIKLSAPNFRSAAGRLKVSLGAQDYYVTRLSAVLERGRDWPDLGATLAR